MDKIIYLTYYSNDELIKEDRKYVLAGKNKSEYVIEALGKNAERVEVVSACGVRGKKGAKAHRVALSGSAELILFSSIGDGDPVKRVLDRTAIKLKILFYLLFHTNRKSRVAVYHSLGYMKTVRIAHALKRFELILEVEELYGDVLCKPKIREKELAFIDKADKYLFPTQLLEKKVNVKNKPYLTVHGTYHAEDTIVNRAENGDDRIRCVYAGTFDPRKGGVAAAKAASYLPENYHVHVIGFGNEKDKANMLRVIEESAKECACGLTFDGTLSGREYLEFIQNCDIGLCTQDPDAAFTSTSFPSKVLSYMANGLRVVCIRIPAIEQSAVGPFMYFYDDQTPEGIAKAIMSVDLNDGYDSRKILRKLDEEFTEGIGRLLG